MALIIFILIQVILFAIASFYLYAKWIYGHWKRKNVPYIEPSFPMGTLGNPFTRKLTPGLLVKSYYDHFKQNGHKFGGTYNIINPALLWVDLELIKNVMAKDFQYFTDRGIFFNQSKDPLSGHLFNLEGKQWRNMRIKLTPTFTSGKMKMMFSTLVACSGNLLKKMDELADVDAAIDVKEVLGCYTTDIIGSCAFGIECNSFTDDSSTFRYYGRKVFETSVARVASIMAILAFPKAANFLGVTLSDKSVTKFFINAVKETVEYREKNNIVRKDFLQLLLDLKNQEDGALTIEEIAAQCFVFFVAGFETSSTTMTFALYELSRHKDVQGKVRKEIVEVLEKHDGQITYEAIHEMKYLDQVIKETLRMYPPVPILHRKCTMEYKIPDTEITLNKGQRTIISAMGLHYDPEYYPEPNEFKPDRFEDEAKKKIPQFAYLPFGDGPRNCIGLRFGLMQSKVGLVTLLKDYEISVHPKTVDPLCFDPKSFILTTQGGMWLRAKKIK